jgi:hypothetical protein
LVGVDGYDRRCPIPGSETDEEEWAGAEGFPIVAESDRLALYSVPKEPTRPVDRGLD